MEESLAVEQKRLRQRGGLLKLLILGYLGIGSHGWGEDNADDLMRLRLQSDEVGDSHSQAIT